MLERMEKQNRIFSGFDADAIDRTTAADLAEVGSDKWTRYPCLLYTSPSPRD